ncbi:MAG: hypothetical protein ACI9ZT_000722 [Gammaproteobacteria bacterium]|jgi:hypothetical protein
MVMVVYVRNPVVGCRVGPYVAIIAKFCFKLFTNDQSFHPRGGIIWFYLVVWDIYLRILYIFIPYHHPPLIISLLADTNADYKVGVALAIAFYCFSILFLIRTNKTLTNMLLLEFKNIQLTKRLASGK